MILVRYMERNPQLYSRRKLEGKRVLELGAGCGLAGMFFALQGAHVTFTDLVRDTYIQTDGHTGRERGRFVRLDYRVYQLFCRLVFLAPPVYQVGSCLFRFRSQTLLVG